MEFCGLFSFFPSDIGESCHMYQVAVDADDILLSQHVSLWLIQFFWKLKSILNEHEDRDHKLNYPHFDSNWLKICSTGYHLRA